MFGVSKSGFEWERGVKEQYVNLPKTEVEIIGHPIHLEHILRAIAEKHGNTTAEKCAADIVFRFYDTIYKPFSLHLQSNEFISWLYGVLVGE